MSQISFTITLFPSVTMEQYQAVMKVITDGLGAYQHLVMAVESNHIPPLVTQTSVVITAEGVSNQDAREQVAAILAQLPAGYEFVLSDAPAAV